MIDLMAQAAVINQQIRDWELDKFSTELQIKTHSRLIDLGVSSETVLGQLRQKLAADVAAIEFLQGQLIELAKAAAPTNGTAVVLDNASNAQ